MTNELQTITEAIRVLGGDAHSAFIWWLIVTKIVQILIIGGFIVFIVYMVLQWAKETTDK